jgi:hypothetical protein
VSFSDEERAELIAALSRTADMVAGLLDALDILRVALEAGRQPTGATWSGSASIQRYGAGNSRSYDRESRG